MVIGNKKFQNVHFFFYFNPQGQSSMLLKWDGLRATLLVVTFKWEGCASLSSYIRPIESINIDIFGINGKVFDQAFRRCNHILCNAPRSLSRGGVKSYFKLKNGQKT